jgi:hypothetical protein
MFDLIRASEKTKSGVPKSRASCEADLPHTVRLPSESVSKYLAIAHAGALRVGGEDMSSLLLCDGECN